ncbi:cytoskeletal protein RodZ [Pararhizobium capsulatum DSM 1112]|uniref:Cytoskeletal protein RodZ n=1 Tax=Pararhizobium capsulatum DSM 1112 TaxID=1121113 RepID=A0ABU0BLZ4_9HYPH|nr:hypothetical protein [Pararhizobium capsulatum]MDQ0319257.1 cytoskeletal protein RodZ [Pararhizobium capsulatum DSM 1112]
MNQRFDPNDSRPINPASWPAEQASPRIDPVTGAPVTDPLIDRTAAEQRQRELNAAVEPPRQSRSMWPLLIVLLAGVVLALLFWLPGEQKATDTATPPAATDTATPPATTDTATPPATDNSATPPATNNTAPATTPDATGTAPATTGTGTQPAPATGTAQQPATGAAPQTTEPAPAN